MAQTTVTPNVMARTLSTALRRTITPKGVRTVARDVLPRFDKTKHPEYQAHAYTADEQKRLRAAFTARGTRSVAQPVRKVRKAATPRKAAIKATTVARSLGLNAVADAKVAPDGA